MGNFSTKNFTELFDENSVSTPPKRVLDVDPRSPTAEVCRTPIAVEKTPVTELDPRSPSVGITRTPIYDTAGSSTDNEWDIVDDAVFLPVTSSLFDGKDVDLTDDEREETSLLSSKLKGTKIKQSSVQTEIFQDDLEETNTLIKQPPTKMESKLSKKGLLGQRSPLTPIRTSQTNSPKMIVQRKQVQKLGMIQKSDSNPNITVKCNKNSALQQALDKENTCDVTY